MSSKNVMAVHKYVSCLVTISGTGTMRMVGGVATYQKT